MHHYQTCGIIVGLLIICFICESSSTHTFSEEKGQDLVEKDCVKSCEEIEESETLWRACLAVECIQGILTSLGSVEWSHCRPGSAPTSPLGIAVCTNNFFLWGGGMFATLSSAYSSTPRKAVFYDGSIIAFTILMCWKLCQITISVKMQNWKGI